MNPNFEKSNGLIPVIIQHHLNFQVLMLGYMNPEAFSKTLSENVVTFYSRSKQRLWTKGEISGNKLIVKSYYLDCDQDTLLFLVDPIGPTCHLGNKSCFGTHSNANFLYELENIIGQRIEHMNEDSYTYRLVEKGINKVAQKVGEEAVELIIEAKDDNQVLFENEAADLLYHYLILLNAKNTNLKNIENILASRSK